MRNYIKLTRAIIFCALCCASPVLSHAQSAQVGTDKSVVMVLSRTAANGIGGGTGWAIGDGSFFVTNNHVIDDALETVVVVDNGGGKGKVYPAKVVWGSSEYDLAVVEVSGLHLPPLTISDWVPNKGARVISIGYPADADQNFTQGQRPIPVSTFTDGIVGRVLTQPWPGKTTALDIIQHSATLNHGNSGGPLLDSCNRVIGVNSQGVPTSETTLAEGVYYASSTAALIDQIHKNLPQLKIDVSSGSCTPSGEQPVVSNDVASGHDLFPALLAGIGAIIALSAFVIVLNRSQALKAGHPQLPSGSGTSTAIPPSSTFKTGWRLEGVTHEGGKLLFNISARDGRLYIGREHLQCDLVIEDASVSKRHAALEVEDGKLFVRDLASTNGTTIDGTKLANGRKQIAAGSILAFGKTRLRLNERFG